MRRYVGLDVSQDSCAVCVLEDDGMKLFEGDCATAPDTILEVVFANARPVERIVHGSGPLSICLLRELGKRCAPVVRIDARAANKAMSAPSSASLRGDTNPATRIGRVGSPNAGAGTSAACSTLQGSR